MPAKKRAPDTGVPSLDAKDLARFARQLGLHLLIERRHDRPHWTALHRQTGAELGTYTPHNQTLVRGSSRFDGVHWATALRRLAPPRPAR